jgi:hypothetical protein
MTPEQALWVNELERAEKELAVAIKYDDRGAIEFNKEMIEWSKMKIQMYEDYEKQKKMAV